MQPNQPSQETRLPILDYWRVIKSRKAVVVAVFLLVLLMTATVTFLQPRLFAASTRIKVEQERPNIDVWTSQNLPTYDQYFLQTQYEIILSQEILHPVIQRLNLMKIWADRHQPLAIPSIDLAFSRLKRQVAVRPSRNTSLIEISVEDEDPKLAADIANTIADVFEKQRLQVKQDQVFKGLDKLREKLAEQKVRVEAAQTKVEQLRKELDVPILSGVSGLSGTASYIKLTDRTIEQLEQQLTAAKVEAVGMETRVNSLRKIDQNLLRNSISTLITDHNVEQLLQNLTDAETLLEKLKEDYGPDHPTVRAAIATRDKLKEQLDARLEGIIHGFDVQLQMTQARVAELQRQLDEARTISVATESEKFRPFRNAQREEEEETKTYQALKARIDQVAIEINVPRSPVEVTDRAEPSRVPVRPNVTLNIILGAIVGLILGVGLTFFLEFLDTSIKRTEDVERFLGLPVLGVVAREGELILRGTASPQHIESYRMLRANIEFARGDGTPKSLAVLSAGAGEGKSYTIANLAAVYAQHGARVLVVDSDLRRPNIHKNLNMANTIGLTDYLAGRKTVDEIILPTAYANLFVITAGGGGQTKSALPLLTSQRMQELISRVNQQFDVVLYDTPPVLAVSDASIVANEVGCSMLVVQHRRYPRVMTIRARHAIENAGGRLLGVVVNNINVGLDESYYYYHDHYDRYLHPDVAGQPPSPSVAAKPAADQVEWQGKY